MIYSNKTVFHTVDKNIEYIHDYIIYIFDI